jgi:hypothetical protein
VVQVGGGGCGDGSRWAGQYVRHGMQHRGFAMRGFAMQPPSPITSPPTHLLVAGQRDLLKEVGHPLAGGAVKAEVGAEEGHDALARPVVQHLGGGGEDGEGGQGVG